MTKIETILNQMPKQKLSLSTDLMIRKEIHKRIWQYRLNSMKALFSFSFFLERRALALALLVMFLLTGTSVYAYNSNDVITGHPLFLLKDAIENVELNLASAESAKAIKYAKFSQKRISEASAVSEKKRDNVSADLKKTLADSIKNFEKAEDIAEKDKTVQSVIIEIKKTKKENLEKVKEIATHHEEYATDAVKPAIVFYQESEEDGEEDNDGDSEDVQKNSQDVSDDGDSKTRSTSTSERESDDESEVKIEQQSEKEVERKIETPEVETQKSEEYHKEESLKIEDVKEESSRQGESTKKDGESRGSDKKER